MRVLGMFSAMMLVAASAGAQTVQPKSDSGCVTVSGGGIECHRTITREGPGGFWMDHAKMDSAMMKRAVLGLELRPTGTKRDTLGVFVERVTPKGPAEMAGIVEGDRIASINGVDLRVGSGDVDDPYTNGLAAHRLHREMQKLAPGARVTLRVYSGGRARDVQVTAGRASDFMHDGGFRIRIGGPGMFQFDGPGMMHFDGPQAFGIDPEHLRMMIEQGFGRGGAQLMKMRAPSGGTVIRAPLRTPIAPVQRRTIINL